MCLSWRSLPVSQDCNVVTFEGIPHHGPQVRVEYAFSCYLGREYSIKVKSFLANLVLQSWLVDDLPVRSPTVVILIMNPAWTFCQIVLDGFQSNRHMYVIVQRAGWIHRHKYLSCLCKVILLDLATSSLWILALLNLSLLIIAHLVYLNFNYRNLQFKL